MVTYVVHNHRHYRGSYKRFCEKMVSFFLSVLVLFSNRNESSTNGHRCRNGRHRILYQMYTPKVSDQQAVQKHCVCRNCGNPWILACGNELRTHNCQAQPQSFNALHKVFSYLIRMGGGNGPEASFARSSERKINASAMSSPRSERTT